MKQTIKYLCFVFLCLLVIFGKHTEASAAVRDITVADDDQIKVKFVSEILVELLSQGTAAGSWDTNI